MFFGTIDPCLDSNHLFVRNNWIHMSSARRFYGRLADKVRVNFKFFKILHGLSYLDFYFIQYQCYVIIVLEMHFSQLTGISIEVYFQMCFESHKKLAFFYINPYH